MFLPMAVWDSQLCPTFGGLRYIQSAVFVLTLSVVVQFPILTPVIFASLPLTTSALLPVCVAYECVCPYYVNGCLRCIQRSGVKPQKSFSGPLSLSLSLSRFTTGPGVTNQNRLTSKSQGSAHLCLHTVISGGQLSTSLWMLGIRTWVLGIFPADFTFQLPDCVEHKNSIFSSEWY